MFKFTRQYPIFDSLTNEQWNWLCDNIGAPRKDWTYGKGAIWFKEEKHKMLYILRWA